MCHGHLRPYFHCFKWINEPKTPGHVNLIIQDQNFGISSRRSSSPHSACADALAFALALPLPFAWRGAFGGLSPSSGLSSSGFLLLCFFSVANILYRCSAAMICTHLRCSKFIGHVLLQKKIANRSRILSSCLCFFKLRLKPYAIKPLATPMAMTQQAKGRTISDTN